MYVWFCVWSLCGAGGSFVCGPVVGCAAMSMTAASVSAIARAAAHAASRPLARAIAAATSVKELEAIAARAMASYLGPDTAPADCASDDDDRGHDGHGGRAWLCCPDCRRTGALTHFAEPAGACAHCWGNRDGDLWCDACDLWLMREADTISEDKHLFAACPHAWRDRAPPVDDALRAAMGDEQECALCGVHSSAERCAARGDTRSHNLA